MISGVKAGPTPGPTGERDWIPPSLAPLGEGAGLRAAQEAVNAWILTLLCAQEEATPGAQMQPLKQVAGSAIR